MTEQHLPRLDRRTALRGALTLASAGAGVTLASTASARSLQPKRVERFVDRTKVNPTKWTVAMQDDFRTLAPEGTFLNRYAARWGAYPTSFSTTSKQGYYDPDRISVIDTPAGLRVMQCRLVPGSSNPNGRPSGCAPQPKINGDETNGTRSEKGEMRIRVAKTAAGWHAANLGWPLDDSDWPEHGEPDVFETDLTSDATVSGFLHVQNGGSHGEGQVEFSSSTPITRWFTVGWERRPGRYFAWFVNGIEQARVRARDLADPYEIPSHPLRWVLQLEDNGDGPTQEARVWYDWVTIWVPAT